MFTGNELLTTGAALAIASWLVMNSKSIALAVWGKIRSLCVYSVYFEETNGFYDTFAQWFVENYPDKFRRTEVKLEEQNIAPKYKLKFLQYLDYNVLWYQGRLIAVSKNREKLDAAKDLLAVHLNSYTISGFFAKNAIKHLAETILNKKQEEGGNVVLTVKTNGGYDYFNDRDYSSIKDFTKLFFEQKEQLIEDLKKFKANEEKYKKLGINYKRGYTLYGSPGTGKTSIAMAIAHELKRPLYVINLASIKSDASLQQLISRIPNETCVLFEDIDSVIQGRQTEKDVDFNFATFLNVLDGVYSPSNVVFIMTTNKPELIDEAVLRKGRTDLQLEIGLPRIKDIQDYINNYYSTNVTLPHPEEISKVPMAEIQNLCLTHSDITQVVATLIPAKPVKVLAKSHSSYLGL